jgi:hypothetical protein
MLNDRRYQTRHKARQGAFAVISTQPILIAPIVDISVDGMTVIYSALEKWPHESAELEIMVSDCTFYMDKVPFKTIDAVETPQPETTDGLRKIRYGLQFGKLSPSQRAQIEHFIRRYTGNGLARKIVHRLEHLFHAGARNPYAREKDCQPFSF